MAIYDHLVVNAVIYSLEREGEYFSAMAIKKGRVAALFKDPPEHGLKIAKKVTDAKGGIIIPGLIDSHFHFMATAALQEMALNISEVCDGILEPHNLAGVAEKIRKFASRIKPSLPILCFNYIIASIHEDRLPIREELDNWFPGRIVIIISMDGHSSAYSGEALKHIGITDNDHNGIFSGEDHDMNLGRINDLVIKSLSLPLLISGVRKVVNDAIHNGIVGIHCLEGFEDSKHDMSLRFLSRFGGILPLYLRLYIQYRNPAKVLPFIKKLTYPRIGGCNAWEMDGSIGSRTASFYEPYADQPQNYGKCYYSPEEVERYVFAAHEKGFQITSHAIGTRGIENILSAYEKALLVGKIPVSSHSDNKKADYYNPYRHRIDHFEFPTREQTARALHCGLVITTQPGYSWMDETFQKAYRKYLTPEQFHRQIPLKSIMEQGGILCGSSDSPIQHLNPFIQIHGMVNFPIPTERLSVFEALCTYTINGAYATFEEHDRGSLKVGKQADFIILDKDPFTISPNRLSDLKVRATYIKGRKMEDLKMSVISLLIRKLFLPSRKL